MFILTVVCFQPAKRIHSNRHAVHDSSRDMPELVLDNNAAASNIQVVSPPEPSQPPQLPHVQSGPL